jgi:hypothetical protein
VMVHLVHLDLSDLIGDRGFDILIGSGFVPAEIATVGMPLPLKATISIWTGVTEPASRVIVMPAVAVRRLFPTAFT